jgi:diguanylate cyclase (GGDEF)-like protein
MAQLTAAQCGLLAQILHGTGESALAFRANRFDAINDLDELERAGLLICSDNEYTISLDALAGLRDNGVPLAESTYDFCEHLFGALKRLYIRGPGEEMPISEVAREADFPEEIIQRGMRYLLQCPIWASSQGPRSALSSITLREDVLRFANLQGIIASLQDQRERSRRPPQTSRPKDQKFEILESPALLAADLKQPCGTFGRAVIYLDLDEFKAINTVLTEVVVDRQVLPPIHRLLADCADGYGHAYAEGGDEFTISLQNTTEEIAFCFAEAVRERIAALQFDEAARLVRVTASVGVAHCSADSDGRPLHERANIAKRSAKLAGRNRVVLWKPEEQDT